MVDARGSAGEVHPLLQQALGFGGVQVRDAVDVTADHQRPSAGLGTVLLNSAGPVLNAARHGLNERRRIELDLVYALNIHSASGGMDRSAGWMRRLPMGCRQLDKNLEPASGDA